MVNAYCARIVKKAFRAPEEIPRIGTTRARQRTPPLFRSPFRQTGSASDQVRARLCRHDAHNSKASLMRSISP